MTQPTSKTQKPNDIRLPDELQNQLVDYRRRVWTTKVAESIAVGLCCLLLAWLFVFVLDRLFDTPSWLRGFSLAIMIGGLLAIPFAIYRWVWSRRTLSQLARLIYRKLPGPGDRLLGVMDLVHDREEQARSPVLCRAAIDQVAKEAKDWDLTRGVPAA